MVSFPTIHSHEVPADDSRTLIDIVCQAPGAWRAKASAVGTPVTRRPLHSPGRAVLPHPVPRSHSLSRKTGPSCEHPPGRPRHNAGFPEQATIHRSPEGLARETLPLTAPSIEPFECTFHSPQIEAIERVSVAYNPEVVVVTSQSPIQAPDKITFRQVSLLFDPRLDSAAHPLQLLWGGSSFHPRLAFTIFFPVEFKSHKDKSLAFPQVTAAKREPVGLLLCYLKAKFLQPFRQHSIEPLRVVFVLKRTDPA